MGHWNYRVMKKKNTEGQYEFGIYEVYYDENEKVISYTENSMTPVCGSAEALKYELEVRMREAFEKETLEYTDTDF
ncbi:MAG TPA: hypothetical protein VK177_03375 [Flavobacteriales bacterium]|nr:hypothetical protein [Flavobacteriales bacterium]